MPFAATGIDLEGIMPSEMSYRERQILYDNTYMWNQSKKCNKPGNIAIKKQIHRENKLVLNRVEKWRRNIRVGERDVQTTGCEKNRKDVLLNMGNIANIL